MMYENGPAFHLLNDLLSIWFVELGGNLLISKPFPAPPGPKEHGDSFALDVWEATKITFLFCKIIFLCHWKGVMKSTSEVG